MRRPRPTSRRSAGAADQDLTTQATQPSETGLAGWGTPGDLCILDCNSPKVDQPQPNACELCRQRRWEGLRCVCIPLRATEVHDLISLGILNEEHREDPEALRAAVLRQIRQTLRRRRRVLIDEVLPLQLGPELRRNRRLHGAHIGKDLRLGMQEFMSPFRANPISYALETDWPVGAAGFEPLHLEIKICGMAWFLSDIHM